MGRMKMAIGVVIAMIGGILGANLAKAEGGTAVMTVSPMSQQMILAPGEEFKGSITISNALSATRDLKYRLSVGSFSQYGDGGVDDYAGVDIDKITAYNQIMSWVTLDKETGTVAPNEVQTVNFTIKVPKEAPAGGQYATIIVQNVPEKEETGSGAVTIESVTQIASIVYASVAGETQERGEILENKMPKFLLGDTLEATSLIENRGNVHTEAEVVLEAWPMAGGEEVCRVSREEMEDGGGSGVGTTLVLPETKRFHQEFCRLPGMGVYKVKQTVRIFGEESVVEGAVIYCPLWMILLVIGMVILVVMWGVVIVTNRKKKIMMTQ